MGVRVGGWGGVGVGRSVGVVAGAGWEALRLYPWNMGGDRQCHWGWSSSSGGQGGGNGGWDGFGVGRAGWDESWGWGFGMRVGAGGGWGWSEIVSTPPQACGQRPSNWHRAFGWRGGVRVSSWGLSYEEGVRACCESEKPQKR